MAKCSICGNEDEDLIVRDDGSEVCEQCDEAGAE
jgi:hypothetical protein